MTTRISVSKDGNDRMEYISERPSHLRGGWIRVRHMIPMMERMDRGDRRDASEFDPPYHLMENGR